MYEHTIESDRVYRMVCLRVCVCMCESVSVYGQEFEQLFCLLTQPSQHIVLSILDIIHYMKKKKKDFSAVAGYNMFCLAGF